MSNIPDDEDDDVNLPAMDSEISNLLRHAARLRWDDSAYLLGALQWHCGAEAATPDDEDEDAAERARERSMDLLELWRAWMKRYPDLRAKRVARWSVSDELALGTRLKLRFDFLTSQLKTIDSEVEYTKALQSDEQAFAKQKLAVIRQSAHDLAAWIVRRPPSSSFIVRHASELALGTRERGLCSSSSNPIIPLIS